MKGFFVAGIAAAVFCSAPALAADMPTKAPVYKAAAPTYDWTGFYLGIEGGGGWGTTRHTNSVTGPTSGDHKISGGLFGATYGYNWQSGSWVAGLEGDISWSGIKETFIAPTGLYCPPPGNPCVTDLRWLGTDRARIGYVWDRTLLYATGGVAYGNLSATIDNAPLAVTSESRTRVGWTVGGGVEAALMSNWSVKLEYLYVDFGDKANYHTVGTNVPENVLLRSNIVRVGLNYKFGGPIR